jgi:choline-sulfatase
MIIHRPQRHQERRVVQPVAQVDVLPTLIDIAREGSGMSRPDAIDPLNGRSLIPLCDGDVSNDAGACVSEYLAEGTAAPMLMIRRGQYKFISCITDPDQLFDLQADPDERDNLAQAGTTGILEDFRCEAENYWDAEALRGKVIDNQQRRRAVHAALRVGRYQAWDYDPPRDASEEYTRSHLDLTRFDITSRYPRPAAFKPKWK